MPACLFDIIWRMHLHSTQSTLLLSNHLLSFAVVRNDKYTMCQPAICGESIYTVLLALARHGSSRPKPRHTRPDKYQAFPRGPCLPWHRPGANFIELLKQKICWSTKLARLFLHWLLAKISCHIACDWYLAVVYLAYKLSGVLAGNLILLGKDFFA